MTPHRRPPALIGTPTPERVPSSSWASAPGPEAAAKSSSRAGRWVWNTIVFSIITRQAIRRGTFRSVKDLTAAIGRFIDAYNDRCEPFAWTKTAGELLAKIRQTVKAQQVRDLRNQHADEFCYIRPGWAYD
jgi:hypothetical protein